MNKRIGDLGQIQAASFLVKQGYRILHQNVRLDYKEADILVVKDRILVVVEVKSSIHCFSKVQMIQRFSRGQFARLSAIGSFYVNTIREVQELRIDLIGVCLEYKNAQIRHLIDISLYI